MLAYDFGQIATPILVALIGAATVAYQIRTQRSNSTDHSSVVTELRNVRDDLSEVKSAVLDHLSFHAHEKESA